MPERPILICYDGSPESRAAIDAAAGLLGPRRAVVLDVAPYLTFAEGAAVSTPFAPASAFEDENVTAARTHADEGTARARAAGFDAGSLADSASPTWQGIVDAADGIDAAVIVIGSRALKGARELVEGSVSHQVVQHAGRPVLVVPAGG
jgi:nucleotide-binding universal stress UspA family protein